MDRRGDKYGSIVVDTEWFRTKQSGDKDIVNSAVNELHDKTETTEFELIAISEAKTFTNEKFSDWTYYNPKERVEWEWGMFFVLIVERFPIEGVYRRMAPGKVFKTALALSDDEWREVILG
ncbi:hypothetical protein DL768_003108 [Monosporascus sp. mg162]|nr:hypothetical protein DL768_003108 [Monosporascus sp. mg162]